MTLQLNQVQLALIKYALEILKEDIGNNTSVQDDAQNVINQWIHKPQKVEVVLLETLARIDEAE